MTTTERLTFQFNGKTYTDNSPLTGATLLVAKWDRLSRNVAFLSHLMESDVPLVAADNPHATRFTLHILAAVAETKQKPFPSAPRRRWRLLSAGVLSSAASRDGT